MPTFRYFAADLQGNSVQGELIAADRATAERELCARGLDCKELTRIEDNVNPAPVSSREAEYVVAALADVSGSQLPLADGLRAAAAECTSRRLAAALHRIADDIEAGHNLEHIMTTRSDYLPEYIRGLIIAGARANRLGVVLEEVVDHHLTLRETRRQIFAALGYPIFVVIVTSILFMVAALWIVPQFKLLFDDWGITLPAATQALIAVSDSFRWLVLGSGVWLLISLLASLLLWVMLARYKYGSGSFQVFASTIPLLGPMWQWSAAAGFVRLLAILLEQGVPLPTALELVGDGIPSPVFRKAVLTLAAGAHQGRTLHAMSSATHSLPASMVPFIRWGETMGQLPTALRTVNRLLVTRIRVRAMLLQSIGPPVVFVLTAVLLGFLSFALFRPMMSLMDDKLFN